MPETIVSDLAKQIYQELTAREPKAGLQTIPDVDAQLEAWKKMPKEQALKELTALSKSSREPAEKRIELEIIRTKAELMGATSPHQMGQGNIVAIKIEVAELPPGIKIIEPHLCTPQD